MKVRDRKDVGEKIKKTRGRHRRDEKRYVRNEKENDFNSDLVPIKLIFDLF